VLTTNKTQDDRLTEIERVMRKVSLAKKVAKQHWLTKVVGVVDLTDGDLERSLPNMEVHKISRQNDDAQNAPKEPHQDKLSALCGVKITKDGIKPKTSPPSSPPKKSSPKNDDIIAALQGTVSGGRIGKKKQTPPPSPPKQQVARVVPSPPSSPHLVRTSPQPYPIVPTLAEFKQQHTPLNINISPPIPTGIKMVNGSIIPPNVSSPPGYSFNIPPPQNSVAVLDAMRRVNPPVPNTFYNSFAVTQPIYGYWPYNVSPPQQQQSIIPPPSTPMISPGQQLKDVNDMQESTTSAFDEFQKISQPNDLFDEDMFYSF
jgi:hypothetical protein